jgi:hypothetical protein
VVSTASGEAGGRGWGVTVTAAEYRKAVKDGTLHMLARDKSVATPTCSQCGKPWRAAACGPTHAMVQAERQPSKPKRAQPERKGPNKWEAEFAACILETAVGVGVIDSFEYEPVTFLIGFDCRYTPDFGAKKNGEFVAFYEVKGFMRDDARVKLAVAASLFPQFSFLLGRRGNDKGWRVKVVKKIEPTFTGRSVEEVRAILEEP